MKTLGHKLGMRLPLAAMLVLLTLATRNGYGQGNGAIVYHMMFGPETVDTVSTPDGSLSLQIFNHENNGDFTRLKNGTYFTHHGSPDADLFLSARADDGTYVPTWSGIGHDEQTSIVASDDGGVSFYSTGERTNFHLRGVLKNLFDGTEWLLQVQFVQRNGVILMNSFTFEPL